MSSIISYRHRRSDHSDIWFVILDKKRWNETAIRVYPDGSIERKGLMGLSGFHGFRCYGCGRTKPWLTARQLLVLQELKHFSTKQVDS